MFNTENLVILMKHMLLLSKFKNTAQGVFNPVSLNGKTLSQYLNAHRG